MGVMFYPTTISDGWTPICDECGITLCYDISDYEYQQAKEFWDNWKCKECNPNYRGALRNFKQQALEILERTS